MRPTAFIFPGQGSQYVGMGREFFENFGVARRIFEEADDTLHFSISALCFKGPEDALKLTENTQPAILTTSVGVLKVLEAEKGLAAQFVAGHSLGEYSALVASGAIAFSDAVK
ncbi:MAG TPA: ACP S-malonyltransferase, partial [Thermodesulfobacteriota bacterium]|nr:ACP S-malonyltransferase [Thermodesulfobacteriota bacterium]